MQPPTVPPKGAVRRWRAKYRGMGLAEAKRPKALEDENRPLKKLMTDETAPRPPPPTERAGETSRV